MLVPPAPVGLLIFFSEFGEISVFAMILFQPNSVGAILAVIPMMVVVMIPVMIHAIIGVHGHHCKGCRKRCTEQNSSNPAIHLNLLRDTNGN